MEDETDGAGGRRSRRSFNKLLGAALALGSITPALSAAQERGGQRQRRPVMRGRGRQVLKDGGHIKAAPREIRSHTIPPVIVDSSTFTLTLPAALTPDSADPIVCSGGNCRRNWRYELTSAQFGGPIKSVRVFRNNEVTGAAESQTRSYTGGMEVRIWLQEYSAGSWQSSHVSGQPHVLITGGQPLVIEIDKKFKPDVEKVKHGKGNQQDKYKHKHQDNDQRIMRFGRIEVIYLNSTVSPLVFRADEGDEYRVMFWDHFG